MGRRPKLVLSKAARGVKLPATDRADTSQLHHPFDSRSSLCELRLQELIIHVDLEVVASHHRFREARISPGRVRNFERFDSAKP